MPPAHNVRLATVVPDQQQEGTPVPLNPQLVAAARARLASAGPQAAPQLADAAIVKFENGLAATVKAQMQDGEAAPGAADQGAAAEVLEKRVTIMVENDEYPRSNTLAIVTYFRKWRGGLDTPLTRPPALELFFSWLGAFLGILLVAGLNQALTPRVNLPLLVASFGASAVLIFGVVESKMAQPRNFIGGQVLSAVAGCAVRAAFPGAIWVSTALGMSLALLLMQLTCTTHPPGGATALIASSAVHLGPWHGFQFVVTVFFGCLGMLVVALVVNNLSPKRRYPTFWW